MYFIFEKIKRINQELNDYIYGEKLEIKDYLIKEGNYTNICEADKNIKEYKKFKSGELWGGRDKHFFFKAEVEVPENFDGKDAAFIFYTGDKGWDAVNPQFILYVNGKLIQGLDVNHREVSISHKVKYHEKFKIDLSAYSGMSDKYEDRECTLYGKLVSINKNVRKLYFNIETPLCVCENLDKNDKRRIDMLNVLDETVNIIDFRKPYSKEFFDSVNCANDYIEKEFYEKMCGRYNAVATCVGHTHIDIAWLWTVKQTKEKAVRSFSTALKLMDEYPEYVFMSSQPQLYEFVKEREKGLYEKIKQKVKEGRWEPEGAMQLEADCNVTSGESLVRQIIYGKRFFMKEFNKDSKLLWLPDAFGYSAALPQILKKSGVDYFMTTKISWNEFNKIPYDTFMWQGIDGSEVLTHFVTTREPDSEHGSDFTTYNGMLEPYAVMGGWERYQNKDINNDILISFGYGDGGGGPTREMLEMGRRMSKGIPGCPKVVMGKAEDYFERLEKRVSCSRNLPKWIGELYLEYHRGTYTSIGKNKKYNRKCELLYQDVENIFSFGKILKGAYCDKELDSAWKIILLNQFHDILPGSAIKEVYDTTDIEYNKLLKDGRKMLLSGMEYLCSKIDLKETSIVVFNTLSYERNDAVCVDAEDNLKGKMIVYEDGTKVPMQKVHSDGKEKILLFIKNIPQKGYRVLNAAESREHSDLDGFYDDSELKITCRMIENRFFRIEIDKNGTFISIYDKLNKREVLKNGERGNKIEAFEDKPYEFDNWNIDIYYSEKMYEVSDVQKIEVIENGPIRGGIRITKKFVNSLIVQDIYIYDEIPRIDFETSIDWRESQMLLKAEFPVDVHADKASYDIQFGNVERSTVRNTSWDTAQFEVCAHKWADLSEDGYGVSLMNDCKYGCDIKEGVMRLTLLKSGIYPNREADKCIHKFKYSLYPHKGGFRQADTVKKAYEFNVPLRTFVSEGHKGILPYKMSFISIDKKNVVLETVKKAEDSDDIVIRMYECFNRRTDVNVKIFKKPLEVFECDILENNESKMIISGSSFSFQIKPYEIKTFKIKFF